MRCFPDSLAKLAGHILPFIELLVGASLLNGFFLFPALLTETLLLAGTTALLIYAFTWKEVKNCGCLGTAIKIAITKGKIFENCLWLAMAVYTLGALVTAM